MKTTILTCLIILIVSMVGFSKSTEENEIKKTITAFSKAGDTNNSMELATYLDDNFRIVMNRLFGSKEVSVMSKNTYLNKIKSKEYGGDQRELTFLNIITNGNTASVKVIFKGSKMTFTSLINLVKTESGDWKLISDTPTM